MSRQRPSLNATAMRHVLNHTYEYDDTERPAARRRHSFAPTDTVVMSARVCWDASPACNSCRSSPPLAPVITSRKSLVTAEKRTQYKVRRPPLLRKSPGSPPPAPKVRKRKALLAATPSLETGLRVNADIMDIEVSEYAMLLREHQSSLNKANSSSCSALERICGGDSSAHMLWPGSFS